MRGQVIMGTLTSVILRFVSGGRGADICSAQTVSPSKRRAAGARAGGWAEVKVWVEGRARGTCEGEARGASCEGKGEGRGAKPRRGEGTGYARRGGGGLREASRGDN